MNRPIPLLLVACSLAGTGPAAADEPRDPGKQPIGRLEASVVLATNGDPEVAGPRAIALGHAVESRLRGEEDLSFAHYRLLGNDVGTVYRSYENWAEPLKPSDEVLIRFEAQSQPSSGGLRLDLELWLSRKKILKTDVLVTTGRPVFILGPEWRGGRLIVAVGLAQTELPAQ